MSNFSPNVSSTIIDKSVGVIPTQVGSVGFISSAQWGPAMKILTINQEKDLINNIGEPTTSQNAWTWYMMNEHLNYASGIKLVRGIIDDNTTKNSVLFVNDDGISLSAWATDNGTDQVRKLNEDYALPTHAFIALKKITLTSGTNFPAGTDITTDGTGSGIGVVVTQNTNDVYVNITSGSFADLDDVDDANPFVASVTTVNGTPTDANQEMMFYAKYPGSDGNNIKVAMADPTDFLTETYDGTNTFLDAISEEWGVTTLATGELAIVVTVSGVLKETHVVSTTTTATTVQGSESKYIEKWLEKNSNYIEVSLDTGATFTGSFTVTSLTGGASTVIDNATAQLAYDVIFQDKKNGIYDVVDYHESSDYAAADYNTLLTYIQTKAQASKRHFVIATLPKAAIDASTFLITDIDTYVSGINSKYVAVYDEWKEVYDKYNKTKYFIPLSGDMAGIHVNTIQNFNESEAPFGLEKGLIRNMSKAYHNLSEGDGSPVSALYRQGINNIIYDDTVNSFVVWGNRTKYNPASDLSNINVVNTLTFDTIALTGLLKNFISKPINEDTFALIRNRCDRNYLKPRSDDGYYNTIDGDGGYLFVCDETNNDAVTVKARQIVCDFFVKPAIAAEFIPLRITIVPGGISFSEISG